MNGDQEDVPAWQDLAGEYALGLLTGEDLRGAQDLERNNDGFRREVERWQWRLSPLLEEVVAVDPPAGLRASIELMIDDAATPVETQNVVQLHRRIRQWRAIAATMTAVAASLALVVVMPALHQASAPPTRAGTVESVPLVAMLGDPSQGTKVVASWNPAVRQLVLVVPGELRSDPYHSHELWVIPKDGKPRPLGTMRASKQMHMQLAGALAQLLAQGATIAISVEPPGGSPNGAPTGPVVASGALTQA